MNEIKILEYIKIFLINSINRLKLIFVPKIMMKQLNYLFLIMKNDSEILKMLEIVIKKSLNI